MTVPVAAHRLGDALRAQGARRARVTWPAVSWSGRHVEFARDVLGIRSLASHQIETLDAYYSKPRIAIAEVTGQKKGKTETLIVVILFDFATEPDLNGFIYGPKIEWINEVLWPRLVKYARGAYLPCRACRGAHEGWCALVEAYPLDETPRPLPCPNCSPLLGADVEIDDKRSEEGQRARDGRMVRGYTSRKLGGKGGQSGKVRYYCDESSDIDDVTREALAGNMVGGGKLLAFGNLLYRHGWFYRAFKGERNRYDLTLQISSRLSPNCQGKIEWSDGAVTDSGRWIKFPGGGDKRPEGYVDRPHTPVDRPVRGMADREGIEANLRAWKGTDLIAARIDAIPPQIVEGQLASSETAMEAARRWTPDDDGTGVLQVGVDVARSKDRLAIAFRRGRKIFELYAEALHQEDHVHGVVVLMGMVRVRRRPHERRPRVVVDGSGLEGYRFVAELRRFVAQSTDPLDDIEIIVIQMAHPPRNRKLYDKRRDEIAHGFAAWLKTGILPPDGELEAEIEATTAERVEVSYGGSGMKWEVLRVIDNDSLRTIIGRSPDKRNACELAVLDVDGSDGEAAEQTAADGADAPAPQAAALPLVALASASRYDADGESFVAFNPHDGADNALRALWEVM